jgi:signal transduction histidine kinase
VTDLLDLTRILGGRLGLLHESVDLVSLVGDIIDRLAPEAASAGSEIHLRVAHPIAVHGDRLYLAQAITNLLTNAIKYGEGHPIEVSLEKHGCTVLVRVRDHGAGIAPADQRRIFGRFERAEMTHNPGGLGLGLYIARRIVEQHAGTLTLESMPGIGSTFTVALPL